MPQAAAGHDHRHDLCPVVAAASALMTGERPNSPSISTSVESSRPRGFEVVDQSAYRARSMVGRIGVRPFWMPPHGGTLSP